MRQSATVIGVRPVRVRDERRANRHPVAAPDPAEAILQRPAPNDGAVARGDLVDLLREHTDLPVVLVTAPAGYGKTTLLTQWADEDPRSFAWLTLDASCNDPAILVRCLILALRRHTDLSVGLLDATTETSPVETVLLPRFGRLLAGQGNPFVLVLDNAHFVSAPPALNVLSVVVSHLNQGSQLVVCGRVPPPLPWSSWRADRRLLVIGADDLRLSREETRALLASSGVRLAPDEITAVATATEGWPAGVRLLASSLATPASRPMAASGLGESDNLVVGYFHDELLARLPPDQQRFLVQTSILRRLSGPLCDAVLGVTGSAARLAELARANVFLVPLDSRDEWFRYHTLFAETLRRELTHLDSAAVTALHGRASRWLEGAGDIDEAVRHAEAAHEVERAARLVWSQAAHCLATGQVAMLRRWLAGFSNEEVHADNRLALTAAWCALETGTSPDHWVRWAEQHECGTPEDPHTVEAGLVLLRAYRARRGVARMRADADCAERSHPGDDPWRPLAQYLQAVGALLQGDVETAQTTLAGAGHLASAGGLPAFQALCLAQLALISTESGDWDQADGQSDAGVALLAEIGAPDTPTLGLVRCVATLLLARHGHGEDARRLAQRCLRTIAVLNQCPPWLAVETRYVLGRAHLLRGDTAAARVQLSEAQSLLHAVPDAVWLRECLNAAWAHVEKFPLANGVGPSALTSAETRVLHLLPTHLSFEQIGRLLGLSRTTVKTEAIAAYRKLGVSSRGEAVERAISLGMLEVPQVHR